MERCIPHFRFVQQFYIRYLMEADFDKRANKMDKTQKTYQIFKELQG